MYLNDLVVYSLRALKFQQDMSRGNSLTQTFFLSLENRELAATQDKTWQAVKTRCRSLVLLTLPPEQESPTQHLTRRGQLAELPYRSP